jgi:hypothetical protein
MRMAAIVILLVVAGVAFAARFEPDLVEIAQKRLSTLSEVGESGVEAVDLTRVISIVNSMELLWDRRAVLVGLGYGSWYDDSYLPFPPALDLVSGFDEDWIANHRYYRVHDFTFHMLMKLGVVGLVLYTASMILPLLRLHRRRRQLKGTRYAGWSVIMWGAVPTVLTSMYWSGKGLMLSALFVALADAAERATRPDAPDEAGQLSAITNG